MKDIMKVSTVAFNAKWGDKEANLNRMAGYIEAAAADWNPLPLRLLCSRSGRGFQSDRFSRDGVDGI